MALRLSAPVRKNSSLAWMATMRDQSKTGAMRDPLLSLCKALALTARWCRLGLFLLRLFDFLFVSVVAFGHIDVRVVGCTGNVAAPLAPCKTRLPTIW
jgi:hypothetical protein